MKRSRIICLEVVEMLDFCNSIIGEFEKKLEHIEPYKGSKKLYTGVDLGTAYIVLAVIDEDGSPVAGIYEYAEAVRDGVVVDFFGACQIVKRLKAVLEEKLETELEAAAVALSARCQSVRSAQHSICGRVGRL